MFQAHISMRCLHYPICETKIIDAPFRLMLIMGWHLCCALFQLKRPPLLHIQPTAKEWHLDQPRCKTKDRWCSIETHFHHVAGSVTLLFFPKMWLIPHLWMFGMNHLLDYPRCKNNSDWCSVDTHFQDWAGSLQLLFLLLQAAITSCMNVCRQSWLRLPKMRNQIWLALCWHTFSISGSDRVAVSVASKDCKYVGYT